MHRMCAHSSLCVCACCVCAPVSLVCVQWVYWCVEFTLCVVLCVMAVCSRDAQSFECVSWGCVQVHVCAHSGVCLCVVCVPSAVCVHMCARMHVCMWHSMCASVCLHTGMSVDTKYTCAHGMCMYMQSSLWPF